MKSTDHEHDATTKVKEESEDFDIQSTTLAGLQILDFTSYTKEEDNDDFVIAKLPIDIYKQLVRIAQGEKIPEKEVHIKGSWTEDEDNQLVQLVERYGPKRWSFIASHLKGRVGKQCRERYLNHLDPSIKKSEWTEAEDNIIISYHDKLGNQWAKIARALTGRTANAVKNHWNSTLRRRVEKPTTPSLPVMQTQSLIPITRPLLLNPSGTPQTPLNTSFLFPLPENLNMQALVNTANFATQLQMLQNNQMATTPTLTPLGSSRPSAPQLTHAPALQHQQHQVPQLAGPPQQKKRGRNDMNGGGDTLLEANEPQKKKPFKSPTIAIENDNSSADTNFLKTPSSLSGLTPSLSTPLALSLDMENNNTSDLVTPQNGSGENSGLTLSSPSHVSLELWSPKNSMFSPAGSGSRSFLKINVKPL